MSERREPFGVIPLVICIVLGGCIGLAAAALAVLALGLLGVVDGGLLSMPLGVAAALVCTIGGAVVGGKVFFDNRNG